VCRDALDLGLAEEGMPRFTTIGAGAAVDACPHLLRRFLHQGVQAAIGEGQLDFYKRAKG
jgi:hypothetical protein